MLKLEDDSPFPLGKKHLGVPMAEVPDDYLLWWYETFNHGRRKVIGRDNQAVQNYIIENLDAIRENLKNK